MTMLKGVLPPETMQDVPSFIDEHFVPTGDDRLDQMLRGMWLEGTMVALTNRQVIERWQPVYWTTQHLVLDRGRAFNPQLLPSQWKRGAEQQCFHNSFTLAVDSGLTYVEGYAWKGGLIVHHAWCADNDDMVIDVTWDDPDTAVYWGIPMPMPELFHRLARRNNTLSVLDDWEQDFRWLKEGWDL